MAIRQVIECCVCGIKEVETVHGEGFAGWGSLYGIELNGEHNPDLCPKHLAQVASALDVIAGGPDNLRAKGGL